MQAARRSTFWEHAGALATEEGKRLETESDMNDTCQTWQSMNLYEMSTTQCARMTQSKVVSKSTQQADMNDIDPSVTDVQQDFDINSPMASDTFQNQILDDFQHSRTNSQLQEAQQSFQLTQSTSDLARNPEEEVQVTPQKNDAADDVNGAFSGTGLGAKQMVAVEPHIQPSRSAVSSIVMYDVVAQSYSTVDEFDEPKHTQTFSDSFDKLLTEPSQPISKKSSDTIIVSTLSGRWANQI